MTHLPMERHQRSGKHVSESAATICPAVSRKTCWHPPFCLFRKPCDSRTRSIVSPLPTPVSRLLSYNCWDYDCLYWAICQSRREHDGLYLLSGFPLAWKHTMSQGTRSKHGLCDGFFVNIDLIFAPATPQGQARYPTRSRT